MHPQISQPQAGQCPICGMDLIPVTDDSGDEELGVRELKLSSRAEALADVQVMPVERRFITNRIRMVGKVEVDETRLAYITARVPGRLDRLYVDYTGVQVKKGDHMVHLYSPELLTAQEELIQALATVRKLEKSDSSLIRERAVATVEASREKLRLWGLTEKQIQDIETQPQAGDHITIYSPVTGVVIMKNALEGEYVKTGSRIYTVADLTRVWVKLDAYESDLAWLHYGQDVEFSAEAYPGETFVGKISFIDPVLDPRTRTVKLRVNLDNTDGKLKPEMFVRATVRARMANGGRVFAPELAGKWISPMHPEVVKDAPGPCDVCGMQLVSAESLGYVPEEQEEAPLVIPASAALITGERAVVYVRHPEKKGVYEGRDIVLGPRGGDFYIVNEGLREGELVAYRGNFKIDSAIQIMAGPSMMNPSGGGPQGGHVHGEGSGTHEASGGGAAASPVRHSVPAGFRQHLNTVYTAYGAVADALAGGDSESLSSSVSTLRDVLEKTGPTLSDKTAEETWVALLESMRTYATAASAGTEEEGLRAFAELSVSVGEAVAAFGLEPNREIFVLQCPMALDGEGAIWLQDSSQTHNPYFGGGMLRCGSVLETIPGS